MPSAYDPVAHYERLSASFPKQQPIGVHRSPPSTGTYPAPEELASFRANRAAVDRRMGTGMNAGRRAGDVANPETLFGEPGAARTVDFRGAGRFTQPQAPPHVAPVADPVAPLPTSREGLDALLAAHGLGPQPEPVGLGGHIRNFINNEAGTLYWPPTGSPMPANTSSGDELLNGYGLAPTRPASVPKPAPTGTQAGPIKMRPGPAPRNPPTPLQPGVQEHALQQAHEARLGRLGPAPAEGPGVRAAMQARPFTGIPQAPTHAPGDDLVAAFERIRPPTPAWASTPPPSYVPPPANVASAGTAETFMGPAQQIAGQYAAMRPQNPAATRAGQAVANFGRAANRAVVPRGFASAKPMAGAAGLGLLFDTVNNPQGMADMVRNPGAAAQQMFEGFGAGANRIAAGQVGAQDLVSAVGNSLGMKSAWDAGNKMGNTIYQGITDPRRFGTNFVNGLGVIGRGMGF